MLNKKELVELAEKELEEENRTKQIALIKAAIKQTLEKLETKKKERKELDDEIKILKQDIANIRAGRLDLMEERQRKNEKAKEASVIIIEKEKVREIHHHHDRWYEPYRILPAPCPEPWWPHTVPYWCTSGGSSVANGDDVSDYMTITCSIAKDASPGTYKLEDGTIKSFI